MVKGERVEMSAVSMVKDERSEINTSGTLLGIPSGAERVFPYWAEGIVWYTAVFRTVLWHTPDSVPTHHRL